MVHIDAQGVEAGGHDVDSHVELVAVDGVGPTGAGGGVGEWKMQDLEGWLEATVEGQGEGGMDAPAHAGRFCTCSR